MFPVLTASSITLTLPVEDSHTGHNCFSMGLEGEGGGMEGWREWEKEKEESVGDFFK